METLRGAERAGLARKELAEMLSKLNDAVRKISRATYDIEDVIADEREYDEEENEWFLELIENLLTKGIDLAEDVKAKVRRARLELL